MACGRSMVALGCCGLRRAEGASENNHIFTRGRSVAALPEPIPYGLRVCSGDCAPSALLAGLTGLQGTQHLTRAPAPSRNWTPDSTGASSEKTEKDPQASPDARGGGAGAPAQMSW